MQNTTSIKWFISKRWFQIYQIMTNSANDLEKIYLNCTMHIHVPQHRIIQKSFNRETTTKKAFMSDKKHNCHWKQFHSERHDNDTLCISSLMQRCTIVDRFFHWGDTGLYKILRDFQKIFGFRALVSRKEISF